MSIRRAGPRPSGSIGHNSQITSAAAATHCTRRSRRRGRITHQYTQTSASIDHTAAGYGTRTAAPGTVSIAWTMEISTSAPIESSTPSNSDALGSRIANTILT